MSVYALQFHYCNILVNQTLSQDCAGKGQENPRALIQE